MPSRTSRNQRLTGDEHRPGILSGLAAFRTFGRSETGATAVEFGLVGMPFLALFWAIIETCMIFWSQQVLESAVQMAARQIYTGSFQQDANNAVSTQALVNFKTLVCNNVVAVFNCTRMVDVDIQTVTSFSTAVLNPPITNGVYDHSSYGYNPPTGGAIGLVRASMEYPRYVSIAPLATSLRNGNRLIMATMTFRAEPYQ